MLLRGGGKNNNVGEGNDIVLPKYVLGNLNEGISSPSIPSESNPLDSIPSESNPDEEGGAPVIFHGSNVFKVLEIDYSGKLVDIINTTDEEFDNLSEEEITNLTEYSKNYTTNPVYYDNTKQVNELGVNYLYTKEQIDTINKNSTIQLNNGVITKFDDNVVIDVVDVGNPINDIRRGQYYCIITKKQYDVIINTEPLSELPTQPGR